MELSRRNLWTIISAILSILYQVSGQGWPFDYPSDPNAPQPVLDYTHETISAEIGATVHLPCSVRNRGEAEVTWMDNKFQLIASTSSERILDNMRLSVRTDSTQDDFSLTISDTIIEDAGNYTCMLQTFPPQMKHVTLYLYSKPTIDKDSMEYIYEIKEGELLDITCPVIGQPDPQVKWYRYTTDTVSQQEQRELVSSTSSLSFTKLTKSHSGIYRCEAINKHGNDFFEIYIKTAYSPVPRSSKTTEYVREGGLAMLQCEADGIPRPEIAWQKHTHNIQDGHKYQLSTYSDNDNKVISELQFNVDIDDSGKYKCIASNRHGQSHISITLKVIPDPEEIVTKDVPTTKREPPPTTRPIIIQTKTTEAHTTKKGPEIVITTYSVSSESPKTDRSRNSAGSNYQQTLSIVTMCLSSVILLVL